MRRKDLVAGIWLIGLGILFFFDLLWPGILILIGISILVQGFVPADKTSAPARQPENAAVEDDTQPANEKWLEEQESDEELPAFLQPASVKPERAHLLPQTCPYCGGPLRENARKVEWLSANQAKCPFCSATIKTS